jgi:hypothetical protein
MAISDNGKSFVRSPSNLVLLVLRKLVPVSAVQLYEFSFLKVRKVLGSELTLNTLLLYEFMNSECPLGDTPGTYGSGTKAVYPGLSRAACSNTHATVEQL